MRTTFTLDDDVAAAVDALRRAEGLGISEAVNRLIRQGLAVRRRPRRYEHRSESLGATVDLGAVTEH